MKFWTVQTPSGIARYAVAETEEEGEYLKTQLPVINALRQHATAMNLRTAASLADTTADLHVEESGRAGEGLARMLGHRRKGGSMNVLGALIGGLFIIALNLALLAAAVWIVVTVLQATGVL